MAETRLFLKYAGWFLAGITSIGYLPLAAEPMENESESVEQPAGAPQPPDHIQLEADRQFYDQRRGVTIAEGNVRVVLGNAVLRADRIEFDAGFRSLFARGSVRLKRGKQYFQASAFRYNLFQNEGELDDVYGVVDLESLSGNFWSRRRRPVMRKSWIEEELDVDGQADVTRDLRDSSLASRLRSDLPNNEDVNEGMACPPDLPAAPDWNPEPWALTAWGGQSIDSNFGDTFLFNGRMRPEYLLGLGLQKRILRAGPLSLELEADVFGHKAGRQQGGEFNQATPFQDLPAQTFGEGILGIGARVWVQPWLNFGFIEGISYNTEYSLYEKTFRENYTQLLNYLGFEVEAAVSSDLSLVGRIHHRSGAFGTYSGVTEGSNAYLLGLRYRWGEEPAELESAVMPPPLGCPDPDRGDRVKPTTLSDRLEDVAFGDGGQPQSHGSPDQQPAQASVDPAVQQARRTEAIARIDQRVSDVTFQGTLKLETSQRRTADANQFERQG